MSTENQLWGAPRIHGELLNIVISVTDECSEWRAIQNRAANFDIQYVLCAVSSPASARMQSRVRCAIASLSSQSVISWRVL